MILNPVAAFNAYGNFSQTEARKDASRAGGSEKTLNVLEFSAAKQIFSDYLENFDKNFGDAYQAGRTAVSSLDSETLRELAGKYKIQNISQDEYDHLLDELYEAGVFSKQELQVLGHYASADLPISMTLITPDSLLPTLANNADFQGGYIPAAFRSGASRVDLLALAQYEKSFQYYNTEKNSWEHTFRGSAFQKLYDVLENLNLY